MFERSHYQRIAHVLAALDGDVLRQHGCLFGGVTCEVVFPQAPSSDAWHRSGYPMP
jgi:hypothetical protein